MSDRLLYEVRTGAMGESFYRSYVWATSLQSARWLFETKYPNEKIASIECVMCSDDGDFVYTLCDYGFSFEDE